MLFSTSRAQRWMMARRSSSVRRGKTKMSVARPPRRWPVSLANRAMRVATEVRSAATARRLVGDAGDASAGYEAHALAGLEFVVGVLGDGAEIAVVELDGDLVALLL